MLESELHKLLEGTSDAAFVADSHGITCSWNRAAEKLLGYPAAEAVGRTCAELLDGRGTGGDLVCQQDCTVLKCIAGGREVPNYDLEVHTRSGDRLWVNVSILRFHDSRMRRHYAVHLMRDIRQRKNIEEFSEKLLQTARELVAVAGEEAPHGPASPLTAQEQQILRHLAIGRSPAETAAKLKISARTLRNHLYHVNRKLGTRNRLAAVVRATQRELI